MKKGFRHLIGLLILQLMLSCSKDHALDCFIGNGKETTQERSLETFNSIYIKDKVDVTIEEGNTFRAIVSSGDKLIKNIKTEVKSNALYISNTSKCNMVRGYKRRHHVKIIVPKLIYLENKGNNTVVFYNGPQPDSIDVKAFSPGIIKINGNFTQVYTGSHGNGDIYLIGETNVLSVFLNGNNFLYGEDMLVKQKAFAESYSIGHCYINSDTSSTLELRLWQSGNLYYKGNPKSITNFTSEGVKGKLIKR